jgi:hypothetical protein
MSLKEKVSEKIGAMEQRSSERETPWQTIVGAFDSEGADGVVTELDNQMAAIEEKFDKLLDSLDKML